MRTMDFIIEYWYIIFAFAALLTVVVVQACHFGNLPTTEQVAAAKEWLLGVVIEAEKELGGGTGALKLRRVYDLFVARFPWLAKVVPFYVFAGWVDEALVVMREMLEQNKAVKRYVGIGEE